jgi:hypothetical protein
MGFCDHLLMISVACIVTSLGLFFSRLSAVHIFVIGRTIHPIQAFLNFVPATIFVTFHALSFLKSLIPRSVCAALAEKCCQEEQKQSETHFFTPFSSYFDTCPMGYRKIFSVMGDETSRLNFY